MNEQGTHMMDDSQQQDEGGENEQDGSLEDMMKQFQQLLFHDSSGTPEVLPQSSQQHSLVRPTGSPFMSRMNILHPVALLEKALDAIPMNEKVAFMTALRVAPRLVARESDPMRFLVFHQYDTLRAAENLVKYWKLRHEWFGDRAYLPMAMLSSGGNDGHVLGGNDDGALTVEDICLFRSGYLVIVGTDRQGSPVLVLDVLRRNSLSADSRFRVAFYVFQVCCPSTIPARHKGWCLSLLRVPKIWIKCRQGACR